MGRLSKKLVSIVTTVVVASTVFGQAAVVSATDNKSEQNIEVSEGSSVEEASDTAIDDYSKYDGVMLHAWNWSFNAIKENMQAIKDAGYTAVQTSPAQACRKGLDWNNPQKEQTNDSPTWYYLYQPTKFEIGNDYLGSKDEFKAMCEEAHKCGIKIVVDVVANHLADVGTDASHQALLDQTLFEDARKCTSATDPNRIQPGEWNVRDRVTQGCVIGMPDINTKSQKSQDVISNYLQDLIDCGADGYRFDAAKSIELPAGYETGKETSDFWPNVLGKAKAKKNDIFVYGEVLVGPDSTGANGDGYAKFMRITGSDFSQMVRYSVGYDVWQEEVNGKDVINGEEKANGKAVDPSVANIIDSIPAKQWGKNFPADKTVGYIETHDLYGNAGATRAMSQAQREVCWAEVASRKGVLPLWFNRPNDIDYGSDMYNPKGEAYKPMGERGSDDFKNPNISVINRFHTAMMDEDETLSGENANLVFKNERGSKGVVLANVSKDDQQIDTTTSLPDGAKVYSSNDGSSLTVSGGKITGTLKGLSFVAFSTVDLSGSTTPIGDAPTVSATVEDKVLESGKETKFDDKTSVTVSLKDADSATYEFADGKETALKDGDKISIDKSGELVITAKNENGTTTFKQTFTKNETPIEKEPTVTATLDGTDVENDGSTTISETAKLALSFEDAEKVSYVIDDNDKVTLSADDIKDGKEVELGKDLEAGKTQKIVVTAVNGEKTTTFTYTVKMKAEDEVLKAEVSAKYADKALTDDTVEFTEDDPQMIVSLKNASSASYKINDGDAVKVTNGGKVAFGKDAKVGDTIKVVVTALNSKDEPTTKTYTFKKIENKTPEDTFTFTSAVLDKTELTVDEPVNITCDAKGDNVKYAVYYKKAGETDEIKASGYQTAADNKLSWTPYEAGTYEVIVYAKSGTTTLSKTIENVVVKDKINNLSVSLANKDQTITLGDSITLQANSSNNNGTVKYKFQYKKDDKWYKINNYDAKTSTVWQPTEVGTYTVVVLAQDDVFNNDNADENSHYVAGNTITITVKEKPQEEKPGTATGTATDTTHDKPEETADAAKTLSVVGMLFASAAVLIKKIKKSN